MLTISKEILAVLIGLGGAIIGYMFREYRNKIRPFVQLYEIDGDLIGRDDEIKINVNEYHDLRKSLFIHPFREHYTLGDVYDKWDDTDDIVTKWPKCKNAVDRLITAKNEVELINGLHDILINPCLVDWLKMLLIDERISIQPDRKLKQKRISIVEDCDEDEKQAWACFGNRTINIGEFFCDNVSKQKAQQFINAVRVLDGKALTEFFNRFSEIMDKEYTIAVAINPKLKNIVNTEARWYFKCYYANLSEYPIVIENSGKIEVKDAKTNLHVYENCFLALIQQDDDDPDEDDIVPATNPLIVRSGEDVKFVFMTQKTQKNMELGNAIRESYDRKQAKCRLCFPIRKVGLIKREIFKTQYYQFTNLVPN